MQQDNDSDTPPESATNSQQQEKANLIKGITIAFLADGLALVLLTVFGFIVGGGLSNSFQLGFDNLFLMGVYLSLLIGFWQFLVILPLIIYLLVKQQRHLIKGVLLGSGLVLLLNGLGCAGMMAG